MQQITSKMKEKISEQEGSEEEYAPLSLFLLR